MVTLGGLAMGKSSSTGTDPLEGQWYYEHGGKPIGPVSETILRGWVKDKSLRLTHRVRKEGEQTWRTVRECQELCHRDEPAPPRQENEKVCPLCHNTERMTKPKVLYGRQVCRKCYYAFANRRQAAYVVDGVCFTIFTALLLAGVDHGCTVLALGFRIAFWLEFIVGILLGFVFPFKDGFAGHSLGKKLLGVQVVDRTTLEPIGFGRSFRRNWTLAIPYISGIFVLIMVFQMNEGPRLGDGAARTKVIWKKHRRTKVFGPNEPYCEQCGYDLRGNVSGTCPECGQAVSEVNQRLITTLGIAPATAPVVG